MHTLNFCISLSRTNNKQFVAWSELLNTLMGTTASPFLIHCFRNKTIRKDESDFESCPTLVLRTWRVIYPFESIYLHAVQYGSYHPHVAI